jgi:hypothetical protein
MGFIPGRLGNYPYAQKFKKRNCTLNDRWNSSRIIGFKSERSVGSPSSNDSSNHLEKICLAAFNGTSHLHMCYSTSKLLDHDALGTRVR